MVPDADVTFAQEAYEVEVDGGSRVRVMSADQVLVPWPAAPLRSRSRRSVRVRVMGHGAESDWSEPVTVEAGLLSPDDWKARFVSPLALGALGAPAPILGGTCKCGRRGARPAVRDRPRRLHRDSERPAGRRRRARARLDELPHRLRYQTYDVTDLVREGDNELEVLLGNGWFRGRLGWGDRRACTASGSRCSRNSR